MTSNIGTTFKNQSLGFGAQEEEYHREEQRVHDAMKENFKPEFLNRIDEIVVFNRLSKDDLRKIVDIMISQLQEVVKDKGISIKITDEVKDFIVEKGYDEKYGARPLRRVIQKYIEDEISDVVIMNDLNMVNDITTSKQKDNGRKRYVNKIRYKKEKQNYLFLFLHYTNTKNYLILITVYNVIY